MRPTKLEYLDWKRFVEATKEEITAHERMAQISRKLLAMAEKELLLYDPPKLEEHQQEKNMNNGVG